MRLKTSSRLIATGLLLLAVFKVAMADSYYVECTQAKGCISELQALVDDYREDGDLTGVQVSVSLPAETIGLQPTLTLASGYASKEKSDFVGAPAPGQPHKKMDLFGDGSITKSFTASVVLQLEAEGRLTIDDKLEMYLPQYDAWRNVTIRQLLNMTSGIFDFTESQDFWLQSVTMPTREWSPAEIVYISYNNVDGADECSAGGNLCFEPGTDWMYSNTNYILVSMIIESVTGHFFPDEIKSRLLGEASTLGQLSNTYYFDHKQPGSNHFFPDNIFVRTVHPYYSLQNIIDPYGVYPEDDLIDMSMSYAGAAGANISNSEDIIKWVRLLFQSNQVLASVQQEELTSLICVGINWVGPVDNQTPQKSKYYAQPISELSPECNAGFGLGVGGILTFNDGLVRSYDGSTPGYNSFYELFERYNIVISAQGDGVSSIDNIPEKILPILKKYHVE